MTRHSENEMRLGKRVLSKKSESVSENGRRSSSSIRVEIGIIVASSMERKGGRKQKGRRE